MRLDPTMRALVDAASVRYRTAGRFAWYFARGKLAGDPAFAAILRCGLLSDRERILDLGCGQGLLAAWLLAAQARQTDGQWPGNWPAAPAPQQLLGVDINSREVARARAALGERARIVQGDIRHVDYGSVDAIVLLDVLHYTDHASQEAVLSRARAALMPRGVLLLRVGDPEAGAAFTLSKLVDGLVMLARRRTLPRLACRPVREWRALLEKLGFVTEALPMSEGTPFANVMLIGKLA